METTMSKSNDTLKLADAKLENRVLADCELDAVSGGIKRSMPNGKTDVIKAMGNLKWSDVELHSH
jgi:hypothetical protein